MKKSPERQEEIQAASLKIVDRFIEAGRKKAHWRSDAMSPKWLAVCRPTSA